MAITKETDANGNVYSVETREDGTTIRLKADPILTYAPISAPILVGVPLTITFQLTDFDGEVRTDNRPVTFLIEGTEIEEQLVLGVVTLELLAEASGSITIAVAPVEIAMAPLVVEVAS
jgi:hypothetical protein